MDPSKGLFRRRPSSASTRSRLRGQPSTSSASASPSISSAGFANVIATNVAQSCPTSPSHSLATHRSLGTQKIPEDEEAQNPPTQTTTTTTTAQTNNTTTTTTNNSNTTTTLNTNTTTTTTTTTVTLSPLIATASSSKEAAEYAAAINDAKREREALQKSPPAARMRNPRVNSAGSRLISGSAKGRAAASATVAAQQQNEMAKCTTARNGGVGVSGSNGQAQLQRSASTVSGLSVRPYSSPAGLHAYTGKVPGSVPSSVHGSRVDLRDPDKGSAIYLGCTAPRNSTLSLSSRTSSGSSAPPSPVCTPPVSPRHGIRRYNKVDIIFMSTFH